MEAAIIAVILAALDAAGFFAIGYYYGYHARSLTIKRIMLAWMQEDIVREYRNLMIRQMATRRYNNTGTKTEQQENGVR